MNTNLRQLCLGAAIVFGLTAASTDAAEYAPAVAEFKAEHPGGERALAGHVWYPSHAQGAPGLLRGSAVWRDITGHLDARIAPGVFPLVLISHGMYGNTVNQAWLAKRLAAEGIISVLPNHPGTTSFDRDAFEARRLWLRATDLSVSLDQVLTDPRFADHIDGTRIAAAGHSLGGYTVMAASGARHDAEGFADYCAIVPMRADCEALDTWQVGTDPADLDMLQSDRSDPRIRTTIAMDIGGTQTFDPESLAEIDMPILVLGSGRQDMLMQDVESRALAAALPRDRVTHIELSTVGHFDFMGQCVEGGYEILARELPGDEMVCIKGMQHRAAQHDRIFDLVMDHFRDTGIVSQ
ncbi:hypothetical protein KX928_09565 [Roseobacter sp. YSTF-M11]|uniref:Uncharacterized protein n=1 Tax=Roseobacter insulae TaxID=2859783 RepID=A0A9X1FVB0_9RHOB|nr:hypothetical protein [Roseobacter insulae]MBW4708034.1 hypothetical protein [Roseobacter insulae]